MISPSGVYCIVVTLTPAATRRSRRAAFVRFPQADVVQAELAVEAVSSCLEQLEVRRAFVGEGQLQLERTLHPAVDVARDVDGRRLGERQVEDLGELVDGLGHVRHDDPDVEHPDVTHCGTASVSVVRVVALPSPSARGGGSSSSRLLPSGSRR